MTNYPDPAFDVLKQLNKSNGTTTTGTSPIPIPTKYADITQAKISTWSEFASWNHLENNSPYW